MEVYEYLERKEVSMNWIALLLSVCGGWGEEVHGFKSPLTLLEGSKEKLFLSFCIKYAQKG